MAAKVTETSANACIFFFARYFHYKDFNQFLLYTIQSFKTSVHSIVDLTFRIMTCRFLFSIVSRT